MNVRLAFLVLTTLLCFVTATSFAQTTGGSVHGRISDESGAPLPGAIIVATQTARGTTRTITSDSSGFYRIRELPVGPYEFTIYFLKL